MVMNMSVTGSIPRMDAVEAPSLDLILYPNPPLGRHGTVVLMAIALVVGGVLGAAFATLGAWPVTGFFGLEVVVLGLAVASARRRARCAEIVRLDASGLVVRRLGPDGAALSEVRLNPYWARVVVDETRRHDPRVFLRSHGSVVPIARLLNPAERREVARELERALDSVRGGTLSPPPAER